MDAHVRPKAGVGLALGKPLVLQGHVVGSVEGSSHVLTGCGTQHYKFDIHGREPVTDVVAGLTMERPHIAVKTNAASMVNVRAFTVGVSTRELPVTLAYDTRAVLYCAGRALIACAYNIPLTLPRCTVHFLANTRTTIGSRAIVYSPPIRSSALCVAIMSWLCAMAGLDKIYVVANSMFTSHVPADNVERAKAIQYVIAHLLADARMVGCEGQCLFALARGFSSVMYLNGHTNEGSWARRAMT